MSHNSHFIQNSLFYKEMQLGLIQSLQYINSFYEGDVFFVSKNVLKVFYPVI